MCSLPSVDSNGSFQILMGMDGSSSAGAGTGLSHLARAQRLSSFTHSHRHILNILIQTNPELLEGSLSAMARVAQLRTHLNFDNKRTYFQAQLKKRRLPRGSVRNGVK